MIPYIAHTSILLAAAFFFYWVLLRKETFFKVNRLFLLGTLGLAMLIPLIQIPAAFSIHEGIIEETPLEKIESTATAMTKDLDVVPMTPQKSTDIIKSEKEVSLTETNVNESVEAAPVAPSFWSTITNKWSISQLLWMGYLTGVGIFALTFLIQFILLLWKKRNLEYIQDGKFKIYELTDNSSPFSFLHWIFINPSLYDFDTFEQIIEHEKVHVSQAHYLDKMIAEMAVIFNWFNPFVWFHRSAITNNLEFLTDSEMLQKGMQKESYQMSLLKVSVPHHAMNLTTNYNESFLSERIKMMNGKKSSAKSSWKYLLILPMLLLSIITLNAVLPEENPNKEEIAATTDIEETKKTTKLKAKKKQKLSSDKNIAASVDSEQDSQAEASPEFEFSMENNIAEEGELSINFGSADVPNMRINVSPEDGASISMNGKTISAGGSCSTNKNSCNSSSKSSNKCESKDKNKAEAKQANWGAHWDKSQIDPGHWRGVIQGDNVCFYLDNSDQNRTNRWSINQCFPINQLTGFSPSGKTRFDINRDPGTLRMDGTFIEGDGVGRFEFVASQDFKRFLNSQGLRSFDDKDVFQLFLNGTTKGEVKEYRKILGNSLSSKDLVSLTIHVDRNQIKEFSNIFNLIDEDPTSKKMVSMAIHGVDEKFVRSLLVLDDSNISAQNIVAAKIHNVSSDFIADLKSSGFEDVDIQEAINLSIHGVDKQDISEFKQTNNNFSAQDLKSFSIHGVTPEHIASLERLGFSDLSAQELVTTKIHGVSPQFIQSVQKMGYRDLSIKNYVDFAIHGVNTSYVKALKKAGFGDLSAQDLVAGKIHGVSGEYIQGLKDLGVQGITFDKVVNARIHGVSTSFIERARNKGYNPSTLAEYIKLKIHGL